MTVKHLILLFVTGVLTFVLHELAHGLMASATGHEAYVSANHAGAATGQNVSEHDARLISAAGPAVTVLQGAIGFVLVLVASSRIGFCLLFSAFMMRLMAGAVGFANPNDEWVVGETLGMPNWLLPLLVASGLFVMTVVAGLRLRLGWRSGLGGWAVMSVAITIMVMGENAMPTLHLPAFR